MDFPKHPFIYKGTAVECSLQKLGEDAREPEDLGDECGANVLVGLVTASRTTVA